MFYRPLVTIRKENSQRENFRFREDLYFMIVSPTFSYTINVVPECSTVWSSKMPSTYNVEIEGLLLWLRVSPFRWSCVNESLRHCLYCVTWGPRLLRRRLGQYPTPLPVWRLPPAPESSVCSNLSSGVGVLGRGRVEGIGKGQ